ncbi:MAG: sigma-70 family RNA polymerase sigma factor [Firmicutes bacterium]|nr:sigma-70 family RNA polymerase sigma factor [Alicyclobacillaceae bacterium]MCL6498021.1 sigma-70 family RNA polymerase sigma factor [Bacillota bacterium]
MVSAISCPKLDPETLAHLIGRARTQDQGALAALMEGLRPVLGSWVRRHALPGLGSEDLWQEAWIGLWTAVQAFRPEAGPWLPFATVCITRHLATVAKAQLGPSHRPLNEAVPWEDAVVEVGADPLWHVQAADADPAEWVADRDLGRAVAEWAKTALSPWERRCWQAWMEGMPLAAVARRHGVSYKAVDNAVRRAKRKLRQAWPALTGAR